MEKQLFKLNERVIDYSDLVQSYVIFPLLKNQGDIKIIFTFAV